MKRWVISLLLTGMFGDSASAQTVFFDDFEGNALLPHWSQPLASQWEHSVSNSQLHVEAIQFPSIPNNPNQVAISSLLSPMVGDFRVRVRMGWEANSFPQMVFLLSDSSGHAISDFGFESGLIIAQTGLSQKMFFAAPPPGMHDFVVDRVGSQIKFILNGELLLTLPDAAPGGLRDFALLFGGPYPDPGLDPLHIDLVHITPTPGAAVVLMITGAMAITKRRR